jgi:hypothetical protein
MSQAMKPEIGRQFSFCLDAFPMIANRLSRTAVYIREYKLGFLRYLFRAIRYLLDNNPVRLFKNLNGFPAHRNSLRRRGTLAASKPFMVQGAAYGLGLRRTAAMPRRRAAVAAAAIRVLIAATDSTRYSYLASMFVRQSVS